MIALFLFFLGGGKPFFKNKIQKTSNSSLPTYFILSIKVVHNFYHWQQPFYKENGNFFQRFLFFKGNFSRQIVLKLQEFIHS